MTPSVRVHKPATERREQLLDAAVEVMREGGIGAATTRAVADRAGLPQGAFHYCFRSKAEMFGALLERELDASLGSAWDAVAQTQDLAAGIAAALRAILDRVRADPEYHLLTAELVDVAGRNARARAHSQPGTCSLCRPHRPDAPPMARIRSRCPVRRLTTAGRGTRCHVGRNRIRLAERP